ncbi:MAG: hypothetical protein Q8P67_03975, partial [archaeon]|nr:hypothetical protein [archaeon]
MGNASGSRQRQRAQLTSWRDDNSTEPATAACLKRPRGSSSASRSNGMQITNSPVLTHNYGRSASSSAYPEFQPSVVAALSSPNLPTTRQRRASITFVVVPDISEEDDECPAHRPAPQPSAAAAHALSSANAATAAASSSSSSSTRQRSQSHSQAPVTMTSSQSTS